MEKKKVINVIKEYFTSKEKRENLFFCVIVIFLILLLFFFSGCTTKVERSEEDFKENEFNEQEESTLKVEELIYVQESVQESTPSETTEGTSTQSRLRIIPSKANAGETITIIGTASGSRGFENKILFYPANKNLRTAETTACRKTSYCYEFFEKKYALRKDLEAGKYYAKIFDRDLNDYIYGYFTVV